MPGKRIEEASNSFMHAPLGSDGDSMTHKYVRMNRLVRHTILY